MSGSTCSSVSVQGSWINQCRERESGNIHIIQNFGTADVKAALRSTYSSLTEGHSPRLAVEVNSERTYLYPVGAYLFPLWRRI